MCYNKHVRIIRTWLFIRTCVCAAASEHSLWHDLQGQSHGQRRHRRKACLLWKLPTHPVSHFWPSQLHVHVSILCIHVHVHVYYVYMYMYWDSSFVVSLYVFLFCAFSIPTLHVHGVNMYMYMYEYMYVHNSQSALCLRILRKKRTSVEPCISVWDYVWRINDYSRQPWTYMYMYKTMVWKILRKKQDYCRQPCTRVYVWGIETELLWAMLDVCLSLFLSLQDSGDSSWGDQEGQVCSGQRQLQTSCALLHSIGHQRLVSQPGVLYRSCTMTCIPTRCALSHLYHDLYEYYNYSCTITCNPNQVVLYSCMSLWYLYEQSWSTYMYVRTVEHCIMHNYFVQLCGAMSMYVLKRVYFHLWPVPSTRWIQWEGRKVCVCVWERERVWVCVCVRERVCVSVCVWLCVCVCVWLWHSDSDKDHRRRHCGPYEVGLQGQQLLPFHRGRCRLGNVRQTHRLGRRWLCAHLWLRTEVL